MGQESEDEGTEAKRKVALRAWLYEHQPPSEPVGPAEAARRVGLALLGPLWLFAGILLAIVSLFLIAYLALVHSFLTPMAVATGIAVLLPLFLASWYSFSRASEEFDTTIELDA